MCEPLVLNVAKTYRDTAQLFEAYLITPSQHFRVIEDLHANSAFTKYCDCVLTLRFRG